MKMSWNVKCDVIKILRDIINGDWNSIWPIIYDLCLKIGKASIHDNFIETYYVSPVDLHLDGFGVQSHYWLQVTGYICVKAPFKWCHPFFGTVSRYPGGDARPHNVSNRQLIQIILGICSQIPAQLLGVLVGWLAKPIWRANVQVRGKFWHDPSHLVPEGRYTFPYAKPSSEPAPRWIYWAILGIRHAAYPIILWRALPTRFLQQKTLSPMWRFLSDALLLPRTFKLNHPGLPLFFNTPPWKPWWKVLNDPLISGVGDFRGMVPVDSVKFSSLMGLMVAEECFQSQVLVN